MIKVITSANKHLFRLEMERYFRARHEIFVGERGWSELARPDGLERDQFDNDDALYIVGMDDGQVYGGSRLLPTDKPHLLSEVFPHLATVAPVPRDPDIYEWTRVFVTKNKREGRNAGRVAGGIICALLECCLERGVTALSGVIDAWWVPRFHDMGWRLQPLGLPERVGRDWALAVVMPIDEAVLASTRSFHGIEGRMLHGEARPRREMPSVST